MEKKDIARIEVVDLCKSYNCNGDVLRVLQNISFVIEDGERVGIVGRNGAGKSTLLNILAGYSSADYGEISINRNVNALLDLGTSLNNEMSGEENVRRIGELMGYTGQKIDEFIENIREFVELGDYWTMPVKTYSSGMKARIAFAQCAFIEPEILIIDEVLGVGDADFVKKSMNKMIELCEKGKILLFVSHSAATIRNMTTRCIWLDSGRIRMDGNTSVVMDEYEAFVEEQENLDLLKERERIRKQKEDFSTGIVSLILRKGDKEVNSLVTKESAEIVTVIKINDTGKDYIFRLMLKDIKGNIFFDEYTDIFSEECGHTLEVTAEIESINYSENTYFIESYLYLKGETNEVDMLQKQLTIKDPYKEYYSFPLGYTNSIWDISYGGEKIENEHIWSNSSNIKDI